VYGGYYGHELERTIESYAETIVKQDHSHGRNQQYIEYLCKEFIWADCGFASGYYDDALRTLCTTDDDLEYFVGDASEELRVDEPTTVEKHTASIEPASPLGRTGESWILNAFVYQVASLRAFISDRRPQTVVDGRDATR